MGLVGHFWSYMAFSFTFDFQPREKNFRREGGDLADVEAAVGLADVAHVEPPVVGVPGMEVGSQC